MPFYSYTVEEKKITDRPLGVIAGTPPPDSGYYRHVPKPASGIFTNYDPTPTPMKPGHSFKVYQDEGNKIWTDIGNEYLAKPESNLVNADRVKFGITRIAPIEPAANASFMPVAFRCGQITRYRVAFRGTTNTAESHGLVSLGGDGGTIPSSSDGSDADGAARTITGTEASTSTVATSSITWAAGQVQLRWGVYAYCFFKLPTTMTSLVERAFGICLINGIGQNFNETSSTAGGGHYIILRWRQDYSTGWSWRISDNTGSEDVAVDRTAATPVETGKLYLAEAWSEPDGGLYGRFNGSGEPTVLSGFQYSPDMDANITGARGIRGANTALVTGQGNLGITCYKWGVIANSW